jgi:hypothetical protein
MATPQQLARIGLWTFTDPLQVQRKIQATGTAWPVRRVWFAMAAALGLALALALPGLRSAPWLIGLPLVGILLVLFAACDVREAATDSLGIMALCVPLWLLMIPTAKPEKVAGFLPNTLIAVGWVGVFGGGMFLGAVLARAAMNRSYLFFPLSLAAVAGLSLLPGPWIYGPLSTLTGPPPTALAASILILVIFALRLVSPLVCIGSFQRLANTENAYAVPLTSFKRRLIGTYALLALACGIVAWAKPAAAPRFLGLAGAFLFGVLLELDLPQLGALTLWLAGRNLRYRFAASPLVFSLPCCPFAPPGLRRYLETVREQEGDRKAANLAIAVLLRTGYRRAAEAAIDGIRWTNPELGFEIRRRLTEAWPAEPGERPAAERSRTAAVLTIPQLAPHDFRDAAFREMLFTHRYEPPRGKEGAPLAKMPIWSPVAAPPTETLTLPQVIYRSLASVREPFRRTRLSFSDPDLARRTYTELLDWAVRWARSSFGASLVPVALSLRRLVENGSRLEELCLRLVQARMAAAGTEGSGCREIIEWGTAARTPAAAAELAVAVEAGNAWILLEDDREEESDLKAVRRVLDLVFGEAGISHAAVLVVSAARRCDVLSDVQSFHVDQPQAEAAAGGARRYVPSRFTAGLCRLAAFWVNPPLKLGLAVGGLAGLALLLSVVFRYDELVHRLGSAAAAPMAAKPWFLLIPLLLPFLAMFIGYKWGLFWGSEAVRAAAVEVAISSLVALLLLLLLRLPKSMDPGPWKTLWVSLAALPGMALLGLTVVQLTALVASVIWLRASVRVFRRSGPMDLARWCTRYQPVLHVAHRGATISFSVDGEEVRQLPLLVSFRNAGLIARFLADFPYSLDVFRAMVLNGLEGSKQYEFGYSVSSLILESLHGDGNGACARALRQMGRDFVAEWPRREEFGAYSEPSTTLTMNALEYAARRLCYLTNLEELVVVR